MPGNLTIPWAFGAASGNVPASRLDDDYNAIRDYVNPREVTTGALAARPAAGVAGRWYFANDVNGGTLFIDTGAVWLQVAQGLTVAGAGSYRVTGLTGANNSAAPNTQYDLAADLVQLRAPAGGSIIVQTNTGTLTNDTATAGPAANGRDQAGAFSTAIFLHFYFIWNGTTLATLSSAVAPPTGPTLPSGYTHWAYAGAVRYNAGPALVKTRLKGSWAYYETPAAALNAGAATTETSVSVAALVPANALAFILQPTALNAALNSASDNTITLTLRIVTGSNVAVLSFSQLGLSSGHTYGWSSGAIIVPNIGQSFLYLWTVGSATSPAASLALSGYQIPNGGE